MRLNPDCIRAILLAIENVCDMGNYFSSYEDSGAITGGFSEDEIAYHARQCNLAGMLYKYQSDLSGGFTIVDLSPKGHEFLSNIREDTIWDSVKAISVKVGSKSLASISQIAAGVISEIIKSQLGFRP